MGEVNATKQGMAEICVTKVRIAGIEISKMPIPEGGVTEICTSLQLHLLPHQ